MVAEEKSSMQTVRTMLQQASKRLEEAEAMTLDEGVLLEEARDAATSAIAAVDQAVMSNDGDDFEHAKLATRHVMTKAQRVLAERDANIERVVFTEDRKLQLAQELMDLRDSRNMTQAQMARELEYSIRKFQNVEQCKDTTTNKTWMEVSRYLERETGAYDLGIDDQLIGLIPGPTTKLRHSPLFPLTHENWPAVVDVLKRDQLQIMFDVSREIKWASEKGTKEDAAKLEALINDLGPSPTEQKRSAGWLGTIERLEEDQKASEAFAASVPRGLLGRVYGAFVTGQFFDQNEESIETTVLYLMLGAATGEDWKVRFSAPLDPEAIERTKNFNESKLRAQQLEED